MFLKHLAQALRKMFYYEDQVSLKSVSLVSGEKLQQRGFSDPTLTLKIMVLEVKSQKRWLGQEKQDGKDKVVEGTESPWSAGLGTERV